MWRCGATSKRGTGACTAAGATQAAGAASGERGRDGQRQRPNGSAGPRRGGQQRGGSARVDATGNEGGAGAAPEVEVDGRTRWRPQLASLL